MVNIKKMIVESVEQFKERDEFHKALALLYAYYGTWGKVAFYIGVHSETARRWYNEFKLPRDEKMKKKVFELASGIDVDELLDELG